MCFGEFDHSVELRTECVAGSEVSSLHRKPAFAVNVDFGNRSVGRVRSPCAAFPSAPSHLCGSWLVKLMPRCYLNPVGAASAEAIRGARQIVGKSALTVISNSRRSHAAPSPTHTPTSSGASHRDGKKMGDRLPRPHGLAQGVVFGFELGDSVSVAARRVREAAQYPVAVVDPQVAEGRFDGAA